MRTSTGLLRRSVTWLRIFFIGGMVSYRALFHWISPAILIPTFLITPIAQILLFTFIGRAAGVASDKFFVIGNSLLYAAVPCLFAMGSTIADERRQHTLGIILVTPASRVPLFLGRALPVIANGFVVATFALVVGGALLRIDVPGGAVASIMIVTVVGAFSCTGLGLAAAAVSLRVRETTVLANLLFGILLLFCGVNVPADQLPGWMSAVSNGLPLRHGIEAARRLADGATLPVVAPLVHRELLVGAAYVVVGMGLLRLFERESRHRATLDTA